MATVQDVYDVVCRRLGEPGALSLGLCTTAQFLSYFGETINEFLQETRLSKCIFTQMIRAGFSEYIIPDRQAFVEHAMVNSRMIERTHLEELDLLGFEWRRKPGVPDRWHEDGLPIKTVELVPCPNYTGTPIAGPMPPFGVYDTFGVDDRNLTTVGAQIPTTTAWVLGDTIPYVPASMIQYLGWGVLKRILSGSDELKDAQRSMFCDARLQEGISLCRAIMRDELRDDYENA
jgi:hypothetical protein